MGCRILSAGEMACYYDSVTDWAFGPVVYEDERGPSATEILEHGLTMLANGDFVIAKDEYEVQFGGRQDPRLMTESGLRRLVRAAADALVAAEARS